METIYQGTAVDDSPGKYIPVSTNLAADVARQTAENSSGLCFKVSVRVLDEAIRFGVVGRCSLRSSSRVRPAVLGNVLRKLLNGRFAIGAEDALAMP